MMKNLKKWASAAICMMAVSAVVSPVMAANQQDIQERVLYGRNYWVSSSSGDSDLANLYYVGSGTEAVVTITSTTMLFYVPAGTLDTAVGSGGAIDLSATAYDTMGELCTYIDKLTSYGCVLQGAGSSLDPGFMQDQTAATGTNDLKVAGGFSVENDTNPVNGGGNVNVSYRVRLGARPSNPNRHLRLKKCEWNLNAGTSGTTVIVAGKSSEYTPEAQGANGNRLSEAVRGDGTTVWRDVFTDDTNGSWDFSGGNPLAGWDFADNEHVVVVGGSDIASESTVGIASASQIVGNYLRCLFEER